MTGGLTTPVPGRVTSADGTTIEYSRSGAGPAIILVHGAFTDRAHPVLSAVAAALAPWFTVLNYDRRGRGGSGDTAPYAVAREIEDLAALIELAGGSAMVFGGSSGAALALEAAVTLDAAVTLEANVALDAAARRATDRQAAAPQAHGSRAPACGPAISKLALWEPPYRVDDSAPGLPPGFAGRLSALVAAGRPGDAVELFLVRAAQAPAAAVAAMRREPGWPALEALAPTLAYEAAVMGPASALPAGRLAAITQPTLVLNGAASPAWMTSAGHAVARIIPGATRRVLAGQAHDVRAEALAPELLEFFTT